MHNTVVTIVLTWNSAKFIEQCIASLLLSEYPTSVLIVDNNSSDSTRQLVADKFPEVSLVNTGNNLGYSGGNNFGIKRALKMQTKYIFILNPDAYVAKDAIGKLVNKCEYDSTLALISPIIEYADTRKIWYGGSKINWKNGETKHTGDNEYDHNQFDEVPYTDRANGCAMLIRASAIVDVGLMDESYFLYYEETDWSVRFRRAGYNIGLAGNAKVWHKNSSSTGGNSSPLYQYYMTRNRLIFGKKFLKKGFRAYFLRNIYLSFVTLGILFISGSFYDIRRVSLAIIKGYTDYFRHNYGKQFLHDDVS